VRPIAPGTTGIIEVTVTHAMVAVFDELGPVHPVYATFWMAKHFEEAGRKVLVSHLEPGEEGIGSAVHVVHTRPALVGMKVKVEAVFDRADGNRLWVKCRAWNDLGDQVGHGWTEQVVAPKDKILQRLEELMARHQGRLSARDAE